MAKPNCKAQIKQLEFDRDMAKLREQEALLREADTYASYRLIADQREKALSERDTARAVLRTLEWSSYAFVDSGIPYGGDIEIPVCPICGACETGSEAGDGAHVEDCELKAALG